MSLTATYICFLDTPSIIDQEGSRQLKLRYRKALGLLSFLAAERNRNHSRAFIASLFWPDFDEPTARINLRQSLSILTKLFSNTPYAPALVVNREFIALHDHSQLRLDIQDLEHPENLDNPLMNESLLTGVFMAGYDLPDCEEFESWLEDKRNFYRSCQIKLLTQLLNHAQTKHKSDQVITLITKLLKIDPDNEALLCEAMQICADYGQPQLSLKLYEHFCQRMERDLGVTPNATSTHLYNQILSLSQKSVTLPTHANQFPAVEKIAPVVVVHLQWRCHLTDPEAIAQSLYDADHYARKVLCSEINAFHLSSAGRGAFFYFGWPKALDDNAWLAVRGVLRLMHYANSHADLELRASLHSGLLLSSIKNSIPDLLGDITEETSLLCQSANNGQALLSEPCFQLVKHRIKAHKLIEHRRRIDGTLQASYLLIDVQGWLQNTPTFYYPELINLHEQLDTFFDLTRKTNKAELIYFISPAGTGKSTQLNAWLIKHLNQCQLIKLNCFPDRQKYSLFPIISCIRQLFGLQPDQTPNISALEEHFESSGLNGVNDFSVLIETIASQTAPSAQKMELIFTDLFCLLKNFTKNRLVIWVEDGHWIDEATYYFLDLLPQKLSNAALVIMTTRQLPYSSQTNQWHKLVAQIPNLVSTTQLIRHLSQPQALPLTSDKIDAIIELSNHNLFLIEQLSRRIDDSISLPIQHYFSFAIDQMGALREQALQQHLQHNENKPDKSRTISPLLALTLESLTPPTHLMHMHRALAEQTLKRRKNRVIEPVKQADLGMHWLKCNEISQAESVFKSIAEQTYQEQNFTHSAKYYLRLIDIHNSRNGAKDEQYVALLIRLAHSRIQAFGMTDPVAFKAASEAVDLCQTHNFSHYLFICLTFSFMTLQGDDTASVKLHLAKLIEQLADSHEKQCISYFTSAYASLLDKQASEAQLYAKKSLKILNDQSKKNVLIFKAGAIKAYCLILLGLSYLLDNKLDLAKDCVTQMLELEKCHQNGYRLSDYDRCVLFLFSAFIMIQPNLKASSYALSLAQKCFDIASKLNHHLWISAAKLIQIALNPSDKSDTHLIDYEYILDCIHTNFKDAYPAAEALAKNILNENTLPDAANKLFRSRITTKLHQLDLTQQSLLTSIFKQG